MKHVFVGDIHGHTHVLTKYGYRNRDATVIQVGDMGIGFGTKKVPPLIPANCRFIRGNHDNPEICRKSPKHIEDGHVETTPNGTKIMYVGGARSQDIEWRTIGIDWWEDEECSWGELEGFIRKYAEFKPDVMVTHDCPYPVAIKMFQWTAHKPVEMDRTKAAFHAMLDSHAPKLWVFGHWHQNRRETIDGTQFVCVGINQTHEVEL